MRFTYNQLKQYLKTNLSPIEIANALTMIGLEIEDIEDKKTPLKDFIVGEIIECENHPDSDHLHLLKVDIGSEILDIVCGARNVKENMLVVVATIGTMMMDGTTIVKGNLLGEESYGMCCSPKELGLNIEYPPHYLLELEEGKVKVGEDFFSLHLN